MIQDGRYLLVLQILCALSLVLPCCASKLTYECGKKCCTSSRDLFKDLYLRDREEEKIPVQHLVKFEPCLLISMHILCVLTSKKAGQSISIFLTTATKLIRQFFVLCLRNILELVCCQCPQPSSRNLISRGCSSTTFSLLYFTNCSWMILLGFTMRNYLTIFNIRFFD